MALSNLAQATGLAGRLRDPLGETAIRGPAFGAGLDRVVDPSRLLAIVPERSGQRRLIGTGPHQIGYDNCVSPDRPRRVSLRLRRPLSVGLLFLPRFSSRRPLSDGRCVSIVRTAPQGEVVWHRAANAPLVCRAWRGGLCCVARRSRYNSPQAYCACLAWEVVPAPYGDDIFM